MKPEQIAMCQLFDWIRSRPDIEPYAMHLANERKCSPIEGRLLKRMGVKPGVSDVLIAIPRPPFPGLWVEVKVGKNMPTETQLEFISAMRSQGYMAECVWEYKAARALIEAYLGENV